MREIKLRLFHKPTKQMYYYEPQWGNFGHGGGWVGGVPLSEYEKEGRTFAPRNQVQLEPESCIWLEYTGFQDKNDKEIYEGDIATTGKGYGGMPPYDHEEPRLVEFRNGCWCFDARRYDDGDWIRFGFWTASNEGTTQIKQLEVIGNIYENPELLKLEVANGY